MAKKELPSSKSNSASLTTTTTITNKTNNEENDSLLVKNKMKETYAIQRELFSKHLKWNHPTIKEEIASSSSGLVFVKALDSDMLAELKETAEKKKHVNNKKRKFTGTIKSKQENEESDESEEDDELEQGKRLQSYIDSRHKKQQQQRR